ncbi:hypothetical protein LZG04_26390 [Saccharothrix sp. S26]|uniref:hypothetical protein n=1 Tax=Saccharothrix sp. S26 TaxID=2907215 RepID=UPI001F3F95B0|nr:hypothetical protein [Saccharothrix sp. S26]MCE6998300.1 hypothetical protein [Saccharothrix sp. S26]
MNADQTEVERLVRDAFAAHEHIAPDGDAVFAAARARIHRRRAVLNRPLVVAAGVVALTLAAATAVVLNRPDPTPADGLAGPAEQLRTAGPTSGASAEPAVADLPMPFALGWLPEGSVEYVARRINIGGSAEDPGTPLYGGEYMLTVTADDQVLRIDVQQFRMVSVDQAAFKSGPGRSVTVNGQPGVESANPDGLGAYELYVAHPDGGSMYVNVSNPPGGTVPAARLGEVGRRIAQDLRFPGTATVTPAFGLRDLPGDLRVCAFEVAKRSDAGPGVNTRYSVGTCEVLPPIMVGTGGQDVPTGTPGEPVQGRETRYVSENGHQRLWVLDAVDGSAVQLGGPVPVAQLYDIAGRLVLPD